MLGVHVPVHPIQIEQVFLANVEGVWRPITPYDGVLDAPAGETLPFETD
ncbi:MAG: hypothetical protein JWR04_1034 [Rhodoglobus sp.]|nr:hypothetical protein [Rhodoglobus sp.]